MLKIKQLQKNHSAGPTTHNSPTQFSFPINSCLWRPYGPLPLPTHTPRSLFVPMASCASCLFLPTLAEEQGTHPHTQVNPQPMSHTEN